MKKHGKLTKSILMSLPFAAMLILSVAASFIVSANYQELYSKPRVKDSVMDCKGYNKISSQTVANPMSGEWEFFYNRWIMSDSDDGNPDAVINLPCRWTGMKINNKRLPKSGYASYRLKITNLENVEKLRVYVNRSTVSYRVFINGKLNVTEGTVSKNRSDAFATAAKNTVEWYSPAAGDELTVVIEVSNNNHGGLYLTPWFDVFSSNTTSLSNYVSRMPKILFGGMLVFLLFCSIVPFQVSRKENSFTFPLFLLAIILHFLTTKEMSSWLFNLLKLNYSVIPILRYVSGAALLISFLFHLIKTKIFYSNIIEKSVFASVNLASLIAFFALGGSVFQIIPIAVSLCSMLYVFYKIASGNEKKTVALVYMFINFNILMILSLEAVDSQGLLVYGLETAFSTGLVVLITLVGLMSFYKMRESQKKVILAAQLENKIAVMKNQTLKEQIKPHFIFNSLSAIQDVYRSDPAEGEKMLSLFSAHLRANVDSDNKDLITFEEELKNTLNYFELENLRYDKKLTLVLNVEFSEFLVPVLSLQPFLENAIKYADTQNIQNGLIQISALKKDNGSVMVEVTDNGRGFDTNKTRPGAVGIKNATERLKYSLNASVNIKSSEGSGTTITIIIPPQNNDKDTEK